MSLKEDKVNLIVTINGDQARRELTQLDQRSFDLRDKMKGLKKDTEEYAKASKELSEVKNRMDSLRGSIGIGAMTTRELNKELKGLQAVRAYLTPGTDAFKANADQILTVKRRLRELNQEISVGEGFWSKMKTQFAQFGLLAAGAIGIQTLIGKVQNLFTANAKLSDSLANVRKTTGLSEEAVNRLNKSLSQIDTRTSREELLKLASEAGKLGYESVEDVRKFVDQADKIKVALGEDLGDDAVIQIAKLSKIFHTEMLNIASSVNSIGQASAASEQYQVDFLSRLAGIAQTAKLSAPDLLGFGAALEINGQSAEKSGTALTNFFIDFVKNTESFGKSAGFAHGELTKLLKEKGTNSAFIEFLSKLKEGTVSSQDMLIKLEQLGIDGTRGANVFLALANNIGTVVQQQKIANSSFEEGTSVIKEFNTRNENFAAIIEKIQKKISAWFSGSSIMSGLKDFAAGFLDFISNITQVDKATDAFKRAKDATESYEKIIPGLLSRYDELKEKSMLTKDEQDELKIIIGKISELIPTAISQFDQYGNAMDINATKARSYGTALREMMEIKNRDALIEARSAVSDLRQEISGLQRELTVRDKEGDLVKSVYKNAQEGFIQVKMTGDEILKLQQRLSEKQGKLSGYEALINDLSGVQLYAAKASEAVSNINNAAGTGNIVGDNPPAEDEKKTKQAIKDLEELQKKIQAVDADFRKLGMNKDEQAFQSIKDKYQPLIDQAKGMEMLGGPQAATYQKERLHLEEQMQQELELKGEEFRQRDLAELQKAQDEIFAATQNANDQEINQEAEKWDRLITLANKYGLDETDLVIAKGQAIANIRKKQQLEEIKDADAARKKIVEIEKKKVEDVRKALDVFGSIYTNIFELIGTQQSEYAQFSKGLALFQQGIDTGVAVSHAIVSASSLPFPGNLLAIGSAISSILALMASAKKFVTTSTPPQFEDGGAIVPNGPSHANGGLQIVNRKTNQVVAESEAGELHVFSKKFVQNNPNLVSAIMDASNNNNGVIRRPIWLDQQPRVINMPLVQRANRFEKFENGGRIIEFMPKQEEGELGKNPNIKTARGVANKEMTQLIENLDDGIKKLNKHLDDGIPAYMVFSQYDKKKKDWELLKKKSTISN